MNTMSTNFVLVGMSPPFVSITLLPRDRAYVLGRATECDIIVNRDTVSRRHAELSPIDSSVHVVDLQSRNGTFIEQVRIKQGTLMIGQNLRLGSVSFILATSAQEAQLLDSDLETAPTAGNEERAVSSPRFDFAAKRLSPAQQRVFQLLVAGHPDKIIAKRLSISQHTVHNHIQAIYAAFGVHSRSQLLAAILRNGHRP
jgi:DNA-binding CsgD family transcriptional regulator